MRSASSALVKSSAADAVAAETTSLAIALRHWGREVVSWSHHNANMSILLRKRKQKAKRTSEAPGTFRSIGTEAYSEPSSKSIPESQSQCTAMISEVNGQSSMLTQLQSSSVKAQTAAWSPSPITACTFAEQLEVHAVAVPFVSITGVGDCVVVLLPFVSESFVSIAGVGGSAAKESE